MAVQGPSTEGKVGGVPERIQSKLKGVEGKTCLVCQRRPKTTAMMHLRCSHTLGVNDASDPLPVLAITESPLQGGVSVCKYIYVDLLAIHSIGHATACPGMLSPKSLILKARLKPEAKKP